MKVRELPSPSSSSAATTRDPEQFIIGIVVVVEKATRDGFHDLQIRGKAIGTACTFDICLYLTPLGQARNLWYIESSLWKEICLFLG
jgi:hypothetical protein